MSFKMKGHSLPGIKQRGAQNLKDGRSISSPFQKDYKLPGTKDKIKAKKSTTSAHGQMSDAAHEYEQDQKILSAENQVNFEPAYDGADYNEKQIKGMSTSEKKSNIDGFDDGKGETIRETVKRTNNSKKSADKKDNKSAKSELATKNTKLMSTLPLKKVTGSSLENDKGKSSSDKVTDPDTKEINSVATNRLIKAGAPDDVIKKSKAKFIKEQKAKKAAELLAKTSASQNPKIKK